MKKRIVVVGMGAVTSYGDLKKTWAEIIAGKSGIGPITLFDPSKFDDLYAKNACEIKNWENTFDLVLHDWATFTNEKYSELAKMIRRYTNRSTQFAIASAIQSVLNSGMTWLKFSENEKEIFRQYAGVVVGTGGAGHFNSESSNNLPEILKVYKSFRERSDHLAPYQVARDMINSPTAIISMMLGFHGSSVTCSSACSSGNAAIIECCRRILLGENEIMIGVGTDACITPYIIEGFCQMRALSKKGVSCPFSHDRDGFVMGEGAAALLISSLEFARKLDLPILAEIAGYSETCDAYHISLPGNQQGVCMQKAIENAGLAPDDIDYINAHGTGTPEGDKHELGEIVKVFHTSCDYLLVSSTKSMTGHLIGGAGALESAFCILSILDGTVPPTINFTNPDPDAGNFDYVPNIARRQEVNCAMNNSFGFGGQNAVIIFQKI